MSGRATPGDLFSLSVSVQNGSIRGGTSASDATSSCLLGKLKNQSAGPADKSFDLDLAIRVKAPSK
jgi:hypothetical protein